MLTLTACGGSSDDIIIEHCDFYKNKKGQIVFVHETIVNEVVDKIEEHMNVSASKEEIANIMSYVHVNPIQEKIVMLLTFKYFQTTDAIKRLNAYQYAKVLVCCIKYLQNKKCPTLALILKSKCVKIRDRQAITGVKIKGKIEGSKRWKELIDTKYKNFASEVKKPIESIISTVYASDFTDAETNEEVFDSNLKIGTVANELLEICYEI